MIARRRPAGTVTIGPVSGDGPGAWRVWFGRCLAICGTVLLVAAVTIALYAAVGGVRVPANQPYRWDGSRPVHLTVRSGSVSCAHSADGGPRSLTVTGYDLVLASVAHGRSITGRSGRHGPDILLCDRPVMVTAGWIVRIYPLADSWSRFAAYLLAMLVGVLLTRREHPGSARRGSSPSDRNAGGSAGRPARAPHDGPLASTATPPPPELNVAHGGRDPRAGGARPAWANTNLKADRIRANAAVAPTRFGRTNRRGHQLIDETALFMSVVAGFAVMPLLVVLFGGLPPGYVTYPLVVAVILGSHVLIGRKLYHYRLGRPWRPRARAKPPTAPRGKGKTGSAPRGQGRIRSGPSG